MINVKFSSIKEYLNNLELDIGNKNYPDRNILRYTTQQIRENEFTYYYIYSSYSISYIEIVYCKELLRYDLSIVIDKDYFEKKVAPKQTEMYELLEKFAAENNLEIRAGIISGRE